MYPATPEKNWQQRKENGGNHKTLMSSENPIVLFYQRSPLRYLLQSLLQIQARRLQLLHTLCHIFFTTQASCFSCTFLHHEKWKDDLSLQLSLSFSLFLSIYQPPPTYLLSSNFHQWCSSAHGIVWPYHVITWSNPVIHNSDHIVRSSSLHSHQTQLHGNRPCFRSAVTTQILKKTTLDITDMIHYRPVFLLSFLSKVLCAYAN